MFNEKRLTIGRNIYFKGKKDTDKKGTITGIIFLSLAIVGILIGVMYSSGLFENLSPGDRKISMETQKEIIGTQELNPEIVENPNVSYPGYEKLLFRANKKKQNVYFINPKENTCYFKMSIILEDGTTIYKSDYLEPGAAFNRIELFEGISKGIYENALLKYDSYSIKDGRQLNGSSIKLTLGVE